MSKGIDQLLNEIEAEPTVARSVFALVNGIIEMIEGAKTDKAFIKVMSELKASIADFEGAVAKNTPEPAVFVPKNSPNPA